jgi:cytochrome c oxidase cbb3-type subunit I/II
MRAVAFAAFATVLLAVAAASRSPAQPAARPGRTAAPVPAPPAPPPRPRDEPRQLAGWAIYDRLCLACHGAAGDGRGPAAPYSWAAPRDFTSGVYKWRSTPVGQPPTDDDLRAAILHGAPGTSMPAFGGVLAARDIANLVELVKAFSPAPSVAPAARVTPIVLGAPPPRDADRGSELWSQHGCTSCHGPDGRGTGGLARRPYDLTQLPVRRPRAADTSSARRRAIAESIATGIAGTSMPGFAGSLPDEDLWALADHVLAIGARAKRTDRSALDAASIDADRSTKLVTGTWPGTGDVA